MEFWDGLLHNIVITDTVFSAFSVHSKNAWFIDIYTGFSHKTAIYSETKNLMYCPEWENFLLKNSIYKNTNCSTYLQATNFCSSFKSYLLCEDFPITLGRVFSSRLQRVLHRLLATYLSHCIVMDYLNFSLPMD